MGVAGGRLFAIVGPSGAGKDTLLDGLVRDWPAIHRARRTISRPPSATEAFESVTEHDFAALRRSGAFALDWQAHDLCYGIRQSEFASLRNGGTVVFNGSRKALPAAIARYPDLQVVVISVAAETLARRLAKRGRESAGEIVRRLDRAGFDLPDGINGKVVWNDGTPAEGVARLVAALQPVSA